MHWLIGIITAFIALALGLWASGVEIKLPSCDGTLIEIAANAKICGPIEFWLNRYQTAIAAGVALLAAYIAGRYAIRAARIAAQPVIAANDLMQRAAAAQYLPIAEQRYKAVHDELELLTSVQDFVEGIALRLERNDDRAFISNDAKNVAEGPLLKMFGVDIRRQRDSLYSDATLIEARQAVLRHFQGDVFGHAVDNNGTPFASLIEALTNLRRALAPFEAERRETRDKAVAAIFKD